MQIHITTKDPIELPTVIDLDKKEWQATPLDIGESWHKVIIPCHRNNIKNIKIGNESIQHRLNAGRNTDLGYEIWLHGNLAEYFSRISKCIAQDDLLRFKDLSKNYMLTESWNEKVSGNFIPKSVEQFFAKGEGPHWYHRTDFHNLPFVEYKGDVEKDFDLDEDLKFIDSKFYGQGRCKSLQRQPVLPTIKTEEIKNKKLRDTMKKFGFTDILQMQYVKLEPNSVIPVHRDDFTYEDGKHIIDGPTQLYFLLSGDPKDIKFKFRNVGLVDVSRPIFINNHRFVHSLVYTGNRSRGVLLAYGKRD